MFSLDFPNSRPCPNKCPQGMVLEVDPYDPSGEFEDLPTIPNCRYRCQDCGFEITIVLEEDK